MRRGATSTVRPARWLGIGVASLVLVTACTGSTAEEPSGAATEAPSPPRTRTPSAADTASSAVKDLSERPQIWFGPLDPTPPDGNRPFNGPHFFDLFDADAPWTAAAESVHVLRLYGGWVARTATVEDLERIVSDLDRRRIAIGYEAGPLPSTSECTGEVEGYAGPREARPITRKISEAGGTIRFVGLQHGFDAARFGPEHCRKTPVEIAEDLAGTLGLVRERFPDAKANLIETAGMEVHTVAEWLDAYRSVLGEHPDSLHLDINYTIPDWPERARLVEDLVRSRGIDFGIFYRGDRNDSSDRQWLDRAWDRVVEYEVVHGGRPDHVVFQSWHRHPRQLLPDSDPAAFTNIITRYAAPRSSIAATLDDTAGSATVRGRLSDAGGSPVTDADVEVRLVPQHGAGVPYEYTIEGVVPDGAVEADVGWRINDECRCSGPADVVVQRIGYREDGAAVPVPNGDFSSGLHGWSTWGRTDVDIVSGPEGSGARIVADPGAVASANSTKFAVTGGAEFSAGFHARVGPESEGSGYFVLIFHDGDGEITRHRANLRPARPTVATATTDGDGGFEVTLERSVADGVAVQVWYDGDEAHWPATATAGG